MDKFMQLIYIFPIAITLHNIEEALWLPKWSKLPSKFQKPVDQNTFQFAVLCITVFAYIVTFLLAVFPDIMVFRYAYFGFLTAMMINTLVPHLAATILMKKYAPGLITGIMINIPFFSLLIIKGIQYDVIKLVEVVIATVVVGPILLISLPILFKIGRKIADYT